MTEIPTEALEAAAQAIAALTPPARHSQLCPVWARKRPIGECDCWILRKARPSAAAALPFLIAEGRLQAAQAIRDTGANAGWSLVHREAAAAIAEGTDHG